MEAQRQQEGGNRLAHAVGAVEANQNLLRKAIVAPGCTGACSKDGRKETPGLLLRKRLSPRA